uniref:Methyltransferase like 15 n=1 Tax=Zonotrichia albicollis TaxID=44394 RepID=A0A8D2MX94_ZONAL
MVPQNLCQLCKCLFLSKLKLNSVNVAGLARRIHSSSQKLSDSESQEQTVQKCESEELPQNTENSDSGRLHVPVMLEEVVNCLSPQPGQRFLDMTFGAGGHTAALLERARDITVYALDRDPTAHSMAQQLAAAYPNQLQPLLGRFSQSEALLISSGVEPGTLDGVLLDAGCSSMQLDTPERGFSLQKDGPLDMRMDHDRYTITERFLEPQKLPALQPLCVSLPLKMENSYPPTTSDTARASCRSFAKKAFSSLSAQPWLSLSSWR